MDMCNKHSTKTAIAASPTGGSSSRTVRQGGRGLRNFLPSQRASIAVETGAVVSVLVVGFATLMQTVNTLYVDDSMDRGARAAARAVALAPELHSNRGALPGIACSAIRRELALEADFDCTGNWTLIVETGLQTGQLLSPSVYSAGEGDMVRIRIVALGDTESSDEPGAGTPRRELASGVARIEPDITI